MRIANKKLKKIIQEELAAILQEVSPTADAPKTDKPKKTVKSALAKARKTAEKHSSKTGAPGKGSSATGKAKADPVAIAKDVATLAVPGGVAVKGAKTAAKVYKAAKRTKAASKAAKTAKKAKVASKTSKARERARSETREQEAGAKEAAKPGDTKEYKKQLNKLQQPASRNVGAKPHKSLKKLRAKQKEKADIKTKTKKAQATHAQTRESIERYIQEELKALLDENRPDPFKKIIGPNPNKPKKSYPAKNPAPPSITYDEYGDPKPTKDAPPPTDPETCPRTVDPSHCD